jgi:hypothetical protein
VPRQHFENICIAELRSHQQRRAAPMTAQLCIRSVL